VGQGQFNRGLRVSRLVLSADLWLFKNKKVGWVKAKRRPIDLFEARIQRDDGPNGTIYGVNNTNAGTAKQRLGICRYFNEQFRFVRKGGSFHETTPG